MRQKVDDLGNAIKDEQGELMWEEFPPVLQPYFADLLPVPETHVETEEEAAKRNAQEEADKKKKEDEEEEREENGWRGGVDETE